MGGQSMPWQALGGLLFDMPDLIAYFYLLPQILMPHLFLSAASDFNNTNIKTV